MACGGNARYGWAMISRRLAEKRHTGALSVDLFRSGIVNGDPYAVASEIRARCEAVMREAGVL